MTYKTWGEMTPEEKGALLLAHHEGKVIEGLIDGRWCRVCPKWDDFVAYRVRPEPRVWWLNVYPCEAGVAYPTRKEADRHARVDRLECVRVVKQPE